MANRRPVILMDIFYFFVVEYYLHFMYALLCPHPLPDIPPSPIVLSPFFLLPGYRPTPVSDFGHSGGGLGLTHHVTVHTLQSQQLCGKCDTHTHTHTHTQLRVSFRREFGVIITLLHACVTETCTARLLPDRSA